MKIRVTAALLCGVAFCMAHGQQVVVIAKPMHARSLSGTVLDPAGGAIPDAEIKLFTCPVGWPNSGGAHNFLTTVISDSKGYFSIPEKANKEPYCLFITAKNFQELEVQVQLSRFASELRLTLPVGV